MPNTEYSKVFMLSGLIFRFDLKIMILVFLQRAKLLEHNYDFKIDNLRGLFSLINIGSSP